MKRIFNEITTVLLVVLIFLLVLISKAPSKEVHVMCYIEEEGRGFPCLINEQGEFHWDDNYHTNYKIQSTYMNDYGTLYVILVQKEE